MRRCPWLYPYTYDDVPFQEIDKEDRKDSVRHLFLEYLQFTYGLGFDESIKTLDPLGD